MPLHLGDNLYPSRVKDAAAARDLRAILDPAIERLRAFNQSPALIAECPDKFNDALSDDYWQAVQLGQIYWEQSHFFKENYPAGVKEHAHYGAEFPKLTQAADGRTIVAHDIYAAWGILSDLQRLGWRQLADQALQGKTEILWLALDNGQPLLCKDSAVEGEGEVWLLRGDAGFTQFGICARIDQEIGNESPICFESINPYAFGLLTDAAKHHFMPSVIDEPAYLALTSLVSSTVNEVSAVTDVRIDFCSAGSRTSSHAFRVAPEGMPLVSYGRYTGGIVGADGAVPAWRGSGPVVPPPEDVIRMSPALRRLEEADWRGLFGRAFGAPLVSPQVLALFVDRSGAVLVRENAVFRVSPSGLVFAGLCDYPYLGGGAPDVRMPPL